MISNQILQNVIEGIKTISRVDICIMDTEGKALAATVNKTDESEGAVLAFVGSQAMGSLHSFHLTVPSKK